MESTTKDSITIKESINQWWDLIIAIIWCCSRSNWKIEVFGDVDSWWIDGITFIPWVEDRQK